MTTNQKIDDARLDAIANDAAWDAWEVREIARQLLVHRRELRRYIDAHEMSDIEVSRRFRALCELNEGDV